MSLNVNFLYAFRVLKSSFIEFWSKFEKMKKITAFQALVDLLTKWQWNQSSERQISYADYFQSLKYSKTSPIFHIIFSIYNDSLKMTELKAVHYVTNFRTLRHMICSLYLEGFSHQNSLAACLNLNLNYLCNRQTRVFNSSLFHYIKNMKNGLVSRKSLISSMYVT